MSLSKKLYVSRKIILEMLTHRNIEVEEYSNFSQEELDIMYKANPKITFEMNPIDMVFPKSNFTIKYVLQPKLRSKDVMKLIEDMIEENSIKEKSTIILIVRDTMKTEETIENFFESILKKNNIYVQMFDINKLLYNVTEHTLVPKHEIISTEEKEDLMSKYNLETEDQLPLIKKNDPVAKYHGMRVGNVCKITTHSETHGVYTKYRLCVL
jgi:DNA-directed RNA polymerases I, II, and III subunit RPABC1